MKAMVEQFFLSKFSDHGVFVRKRATTLFYVDCIMLFLLVLIGIAFTVFVGKGLTSAYIAIAATMSVYIASILLLKSGRYNISAIVVTLMSAFVIASGFVLKIITAPQEAYTSYIYFMFFAVVQTALFSSKLIIHIVSITLISVNVICFLLARGKVEAVFLKGFSTGMVESVFSLIFVYSMSLLIMSINRAAVSAAEKETVENREKNKALELMISTSKEISNELNVSSNELNDMSLNMSTSSQSQAASAEEIMATL